MINIAEVRKIRENNEDILNIEFVSRLDDEAEIIIKKYNDILIEYNNFRKKADILNYNYNEIVNICREKNQNQIIYESKIEAYLSSTKKFVDTWQKEINANFKFLLPYFSEQVAYIYDSYFEYRFIYNLRNFSQHIGDSLSYIAGSLYEDSKIIINKSYILKYPDKLQKKFETELRNITSENLDISNAVMVVNNELINFHNEIVKRIINEEKKYVEAAINVDSFYKYYSKKGGYLILTKFDLLNVKDNTEKNLDFYEIYNNYANTILKNVIIKWD